MTDKEQIIHLYSEMYTAMVNKDRAELERVHDDSFVLVHMTGMRQPKEVFGGGKHTWQLQLRFQLVKKNGEWRFALASASTY